MAEFEEQFEEQQDADLEASFMASRTRVKKRDEDENGEGRLTVDVYQTDDEIVVKSTIAGVNADDLDIAVSNDTVTIKGSRHSEEKTRSSNYYHQELYWGSFSRTIILPEDVDSDNVKATLKNGLLTLRLPKLSKTRTKKVKIAS